MNLAVVLSIRVIWIFYLFIGVYLLRKLKNCKTASMQKKQRRLALFFLMLGLIGIAGLFLGNQALEFAIAAIPVNLLLIGTALLRMVQISHCNIAIMATYGDNLMIGRRYGSNCSPIFQYSFKGKAYMSFGFDMISLKKLNKFFEQGKSYQIYVNESNPDQCLWSKRGVSAVALLMGIAGILLLIISILCLRSMI